MKNIFRKIARTATFTLFRLLSRKHWSLLKYYPHVIPDDTTLQKWQLSEWEVYQNWINEHSILSTDQWIDHHVKAKSGNSNVKISIITPVYNTDPAILKECILSVRTQTSPFWELILVDDSSTKPETHEVLKSKLCKDPRINILFSEEKKATGISATTNRGIEKAKGDYVIFLDHDDRLAPEAIEKVNSSIDKESDIDIIYSDRDMISPDDKRFMHLMKPDWSPDNLYGGNYIFHLMCYRLDIVLKVGKLRSEYDGSQDYDLILRCMELTPKVKHIPEVLYHWRQHKESVSLDDDAKCYAFDAGIAALQDALRRRKITGRVTENQSLWRGNYQIHPTLPDEKDIGYIIIPKNLLADQYVDFILSNKIMKNPPSYIFINWEECESLKNTARILASWLNLKNIGMASGCIMDSQDILLSSGMTFNEQGEPFSPYSGYDLTENGYMAVTKTARNISVPTPSSVIIKRELWFELEGFDSSFKSGYAMIDFALTSLQKKWRIMYVPLAQSKCRTSEFNVFCSPTEKKQFVFKWKEWLDKGDPYYNSNLKKNSPNYELA